MSNTIFSKMKKEDITEIAYNWQVVFGDSKEAAARLITAFDRNGIFYKAEADGIIAASVGLVNMSYHLEREELPAAYIYAAMTLPEYRGEGLMRGLMEYSLRECHRRQIPLCTVYPASERLYAYYGRFGFHTAFFAAKTSEMNKQRIGAADAKEDAKDSYLIHKSVPYSLQKSKEIFELAVREWTGSGGEVRAVPGGYAFLREADDTLIVKELISSEPQNAKNFLAAKYPCKASYLFHTPCRNGVNDGAVIPMGQARITHTAAALAALAAEQPELAVTIKTTDELIPGNSGVFRMQNGSVEHLDDSAEFERELTGEELCSLVLTGGGRGKPYFNIVFD